MSDTDLLDQIEEIRAANNKLWMGLVRLAINVDPKRAKAILRKIAESDGEVRRLTKELAK